MSKEFGVLTTPLGSANFRDTTLFRSGFGARVHWGKLHFLTRDQLAARYPESERFIAIRRELDPRGVFLNDHLRELFA